MTWGHRSLPWPDCLTPAMRRTVDAVRAQGTHKAAALALGVSQSTVDLHLEKARRRAGVTSTAALLDRLAAEGGTTC